MANIFIYGGCVSRDTFEYLKDDHTLVHYVARQSLVSSNSRPSRLMKTSHLSDGFQHRSVKGDINSSLFPLIKEKGPKVNLFLFDILSERLGVYRLPGGAFVTKSTELAKTKLIDRLEKPAASVMFGTERHFQLWKASVDNFALVLRAANLFERALFIETPWANTTAQGNNVPKFRGWTAEHANEMYQPYYSYLREVGFNSITIPKELVLSTEDHRWGAAPYHYCQETYLWLKKEIVDYAQTTIIS